MKAREATLQPSGARYVRAPSAIHFPTDGAVPESKRHLLARTALFDILTLALGDRAAIGSDQFVYWNAKDPRACLAPDLFVRLGAADDLFDSWKTWERGAPQVAVEILSEPDEMVEKVARYHELGVEELVAFDPDDDAAPLRMWCRVEGDLVERELGGARTVASEALGLHWVVVPDAGQRHVLRIARDEAGKELLPTRAEREHEAREAAEARVRELEAKLRE